MACRRNGVSCTEDCVRLSHALHIVDLQTCRLAVAATRRDIQGPTTVTRMKVALPQPAAQREIQLATGSSHWLVRGKVSSR